MSKLKIRKDQRVIVKMTPRDNMESGAFYNKRMEVQKEINSPSRMVNIDKSIFRKTEKEKQELKLAKLKYKVDLLNEGRI